MRLKYCEDDGGRAAADYKGIAKDCVVRAISIATQQPYTQVYQDFMSLMRAAPYYMWHKKTKSDQLILNPSPRNGISHELMSKYLESRGFTYVALLPAMPLSLESINILNLPSSAVLFEINDNHLTVIRNHTLYDHANIQVLPNQKIAAYWDKKKNISSHWVHTDDMREKYKKNRKK